LDHIAIDVNIVHHQGLGALAPKFYQVAEILLTVIGEEGVQLLISVLEEGGLVVIVALEHLGALL